MARNPAYDVTYYCNATEYLVFEPEIDGYISVVSVDTDDLDFNAILEGAWVIGLIFSGDVGDFNPTLLGVNIYIEYLKSDWVKWSKIGHFDFTIDKSNLAGEMPIGWKGDIYKIGKLGNTLMVYGSGGVVRLQPADNVFGKMVLLSKGIKSKGAVLITESYHLTIDKTGCLWRFSDKVERLGYEEYLSTMATPVMCHDEVEDLIYICNGTYGFVFNSTENSMGQGPINLTGIGYHEGQSYFMATTTTLAAMGFEVGIDTIDMGNRNFKTITDVEIGVDSTSTFQIGISFKNGISPTFIGPVWFNVTPEGRCFPNCWGKDHRIYVKTTPLDQFKLSYIKVEGQIADFNPLDA